MGWTSPDLHIRPNWFMNCSRLMDPGGEVGGPGGKMKTHDVPYRAIVPEKVDGLLMAGRCISATHVGAAAAKSMGNCIATGHAAGLAAFLAIKRGIQPREVKVSELQDRLRAEGVDLDFVAKTSKPISGLKAGAFGQEDEWPTLRSGMPFISRLKSLGFSGMTYK